MQTLGEPAQSEGAKNVYVLIIDSKIPLYCVLTKLDVDSYILSFWWNTGTLACGQGTVTWMSSLQERSNQEEPLFPE